MTSKAQLVSGYGYNWNIYYRYTAIAMHTKKKPFTAIISQKGFALISTILIMSLLMVVALAMLGLSSIESRSSSVDRNQLMAEANARMALMLAVAKLQEDLGPDQRISAHASILDTDHETADIKGVNNAGWLGVWNARKSTMDPTYEEGREASFRSWLVSSSAGDPGFSDAKNMDLDDNNSVIIKESLDQDIRAGLVNVEDGRFAWHVSDNSTNARSNLGKKEDGGMDSPTLIARRSMSERHAPELLEDLSAMDVTEETTAKIVSDQSAVLAVEDKNSWDYPLSSSSNSLLTNVANGGFKKDINTLFEIEDLDIFKDLGYGAWEGQAAINDDNSYLYGPRVALGAKWNNLYAYYNLYKDTRMSYGVPEVKLNGNLIDWHLADQKVDFGDEAGGFRFPRITKITYLFSYTSKKVEVNGQEKYRLSLVTDIILTLWNPYNARIVFPDNCCMFIKFSRSIPMKFDWHVNGQSKGEAALNQIISSVSGGGYHDQLYTQSRIKREKYGHLFAIDPGETVVFTMNSQQFYNKGNDPDFVPGLRHDFGLAGDTLLGGSSKLEGNAGEKISVTLKPDKTTSGYGGKSQHLTFWIYRQWPYYEHRGEIIADRNADFVDGMKVIEHEDVPSVTFSQADGQKIPFGALMIETKTSQDSEVASKVFLNSGITRLSSRMGSTPQEGKAERLEYRLEAITDLDSDLIQVSTANSPFGPNHGYIGSGRTAQTGVTHMAHSGIPLLPMTSLAQFRHAGVGDGAASIRASHWGLNSTPNPPFMDYAVGNSYAHPLISKNKSSELGAGTEYFDHSYLSNEILWDDYFCSSLSNQSRSILPDGRKLDAIWTDFVDGKESLLNQRYHLHQGRNTADQIKQAVLDGDKLKTDAHKDIAQHLLYDGGFNVNSTSVDAWKVFLSGSSKTRIQLVEGAINTPAIKDERAEGVVFSRTSLPLSSSMDKAANDDDKRHRAFLGYRDLDDVQMTRLAEEIVKQVKLRGPFLNLADFINRQLSDKADLAKMGALQAAIDDSGINDDIEAMGLPVSANPAYNFPEAFAGNSAMGSPGWLMQGDILTQLGSSVFVRGDTFTIRAYGDARDGEGKAIATAMCEATVQRYPDYLNASEDASVSPATKPDNLKYGRKFRIITFRWLNREKTN
jgi:hypothetical protein